jgi:hypothetical protein
MIFPFLSAYAVKRVQKLTLPQMYDPEKRARANQRKMNDVIDRPDISFAHQWSVADWPEVLGRVMAQKSMARAKART